MNKLLFTSKGRMSRSYYIASYFGLIIYVFLCVSIIGFVESFLQSPKFESFLWWLLIPIVFYVVFCISLKRLHDLNQSGWLVLILFMPVPLIRLVFIIYLMLYKGTTGLNKYGSDPLQSKIIQEPI